MITTLVTGGSTKAFTLKARDGTRVTLQLPHGTQLVGSNKFYGVEPNGDYLHAVEPNPALSGRECTHTKNDSPLSGNISQHVCLTNTLGVVLQIWSA